ncbi:Uma2 family endonuclease [Pseudanabaena sp. PCC 6802]|uniref:Uma2 family endonuclease n=1 Tax=Pseudanabaena sp. PCC 6802 TaxID=118173 RepID=UPI0003482725|nr:Uma2 family endonuclease [Pseudanabaena sp. PCC 6802]
MPIATQPEKHILSLEEFLELPETKPASEYNNGQICQKVMPQGKHSKLQVGLSGWINQKGEADRSVYALTELRCTFSGRSIVPDIAVFTWERIPVDEAGEIINKITIAPDWIVEILSPDQSSIQTIEKIGFAIKHGTKLGWLIASEERTVLVFQGDRLPEIKQGDDLLPVLDELKDWHLSANDLFSLLTFASK